MSRHIRIHKLLRRLINSYVLTKLSVAFGLFLLLSISFAYIAKQVHEGDTLTRDTEILLKINGHASSVLDVAMLGVTYTGNILSVVVIGALLSFWLYKRARIRAIVQVAFAVGGAIVANALLKLIFQRERPELWQVMTHESTYSFPSGHALITAALATTIILLWRNRRLKWVVVFFALTYVVAVGLSRLYLGVHYPTDVIAGWCFGAAWAIMVAYIIESAEKNRAKSISKL